MQVATKYHHATTMTDAHPIGGELIMARANLRPFLSAKV